MVFAVTITIIAMTISDYLRWDPETHSGFTLMASVNGDATLHFAVGKSVQQGCVTRELTEPELNLEFKSS